MMTNTHCTNCGKELEEFEDIVLVASGYVGQIMEGEWAAQESDSPYIHILCKTCAEGLVIRTKATALKSCTEALAQEEDSDFCSVCGAVVGHLPGCPDGMASVNLRA